MRRIVLAPVFIVVGFLMPIAAQADIPKGGIVVSDGLRIRNSPNLNGQVVGGLKNGTFVEITSMTEDKMRIGDMEDYWYKVSTDGMTGWAYGYFISTERTYFRKTGISIYSGRNMDDPEEVFFRIPGLDLSSEKGHTVSVIREISIREADAFEEIIRFSESGQYFYVVSYNNVEGEILSVTNTRLGEVIHKSSFFGKPLEWDGDFLYFEGKMGGERVPLAVRGGGLYDLRYERGPYDRSDVEAAKTDWDQDELNGKVKRRTTYEGGTKKSMYEYDEYGRLVKGEKYKYDETLENIIFYRHDKAGNLIEETIFDAKYGNLNYKTVWEYNRYGKRIDEKVNIQLMLHSHRTWQYDGRGKLIQLTFMENQGFHTAFFTYKYQYDANGKLIEEREFRSEEEKLAEISRYTYDSLGKIIKMEDVFPSGEINGYEIYDYDKEGQKTQSDSYYPDGKLGSTLTFARDRYGNVTSKTHKQWNKVTEYRYVYW